MANEIIYLCECGRRLETDIEVYGEPLIPQGTSVFQCPDCYDSVTVTRVGNECTVVNTGKYR